MTRPLPGSRRPLAGVLRWLALPLLCALPALSPAPAWSATQATYEVRGLSADATIVVDNFGVPHIYAQSHYDAFFVQGFNAARDRLWQIDTWRRRGLGQLAAVLGPEYVAQDRAARLFLYRGDMYREWLAYSSDAKRIAEAFVAGINAFIDLIDEQPDLLPPEFALLDYAPARWQAADVVRIRSHGLWRNVVSEVARARRFCAGEARIDTYRKVLEPPWQAALPAGLDPCSLPANVLDDYLLATAPVNFEAGSPDATVAAARQVHADRAALQLGSNNWAIAPSRTTTGRPILADDPHRTHAVPSLRYIAHLSAPGLDVIGAGEPALPGVSIGHNGRIAFGLTIFPIDQEDLYVYELVRAPGTSDGPLSGYLYNGQYEPLQRVTERIEVRGEATRLVTLEFTRHGPVVARTDNARPARAFAVRAAWLTPGMAPYFGSVEYMRAGNWREFVAALNRWGAPSENQVYADTDGNIGYKPAGLFPRRRNFDGLLPVPGDGRYEWDGFWDMDVLPEEYNPERGWVGTANANNLPPDYDINTYRVGFEWSAPWRYRRLIEVLSTDTRFAPKNSIALQRDYTSTLAQAVLVELESLRETTPRDSAEAHAPGLRLLRHWQGRMGRESPQAAFFAIWYYRHLMPALAERVTAGKLKRIDSLAAVAALPAHRDLLPPTLSSAWREAEALLGTDQTQWQWGNLHQMRFTHPLLSRTSGAQRERFALPAVPRGGTRNTLNNTGFRTEDFLVRSGASFRMVLDVGNWDAAAMTNAPGQSGDPRSPFYGNLLEGWANERSFPLLYSRYRVEQNAFHRIRLQAPADDG